MHCLHCDHPLTECVCPDFKERIDGLRSSKYLAIDWDALVKANDEYRALLAHNTAQAKTIEEPGPERVRLTDDYFDLKTGVGFPVDTILVRSPHGTGQYAPEGARLGEPCVPYFAAIKNICEPLTQPHLTE